MSKAIAEISSFASSHSRAFKRTRVFRKRTRAFSLRYVDTVRYVLLVVLPSAGLAGLSVAADGMLAIYSADTGWRPASGLLIRALLCTVRQAVPGVLE